MSIARLKKVTVCGLLTEKQKLLQGLQALGCMHLLALRPAPAEVEKAATPRAEAAYRALRFLSDMPEKRKQVTRDPSFDVSSVVQQALDVKDRLRDATDRNEFLGHRIEQIKPWGDIAFPPLAELAHQRLWFYILPIRKLGALEAVELPWQIVKRDQRQVYVVVIAEHEPPADLLPVPRTYTGALPLNELKAQLEDNEIEIEDIVAERYALTRYIYLLSVNLAEAENRASLIYADQQTRDEAGITAIQAWVPEDAIKAVEAYVEQAGLACLIEDPDANDDPPTMIEQPDEMKAGVDLAMFYTVPPYRSWDPSVVLSFSFALFFAMIISDAGYGLVLMILLLAYWQRLGKSAQGRAYRLLGASLFGTAVVYGVLVGSYFGVTPPDDSLLGRMHLLDIGDYAAMMKISIIIGVLHLVLANALVALQNRGRSKAIANLGWIACLCGGVLLAYSEPDSGLASVALALLISGLGTVLLFTSERPIVKLPVDVVWRLVDGLRALTGVMGLFGDVLSYMRLFALGLASASLALTFNNLATQIVDAVPGLGLLLALLLLLLGHTINLALAVMSGVVHGLRLNFIEFYKWGMTGEGKPFQKFARKEVEP
ncbi:MAG: V-type ATP synthase subunit I [Gammaproteobacteria bacterium]|nr:V-type ATP synthase subunit I [Gammaproteobacteria bacterium]